MHGDYQRPKKRVTALFTLISGEIEEGVFLMPLDDDLNKLMNNQFEFIEFEDKTGKINLLSKSAVARVVEIGEVHVGQSLPDTQDAA